MTATAGAPPMSFLRDEIFDRMDELSPVSYTHLTLPTKA